MDIVDLSACDPELEDFGVLVVDVLDTVNVRQLVAGRIHAPVVRVAHPLGVLRLLVALQHPTRHRRAWIAMELLLLAERVNPRFLVKRRVVLDVVFLQEVLRVHPAGPDHPVDPHRQPVRRQRRRRVIGQLQGRGIDLGHGHQGALARTCLVRRVFLQFLDLDLVLPPEQDVVHRPRMAIGPLQPLAEVQRPLRRIRVGFPLLRQARPDLKSVTQVSQRRMPVLQLRHEPRGAPLVVVAPHVERATVLANRQPLVWHDVRAIRQALVHRWQCPGRHLRGQRRRLAVRLLRACNGNAGPGDRSHCGPDCGHGAQLECATPRDAGLIQHRFPL